MSTSSGSWLSIYLLAPALGWLAAQGLKTLLKVVVNTEKQQKTSELFRSGGMPSAHSATMVSLATVIGVADGFYNPLFAVTAMLTVIVLYDATHVRRAVGEQGKVLKAETKKSFYLAEGHTLKEVVAGSILGFAVALILLQIL